MFVTQVFMYAVHVWNNKRKYKLCATHVHTLCRRKMHNTIIIKLISKIQLLYLSVHIKHKHKQCLHLASGPLKLQL